jgi:glucose-6-phosphate isomerase
MLSLDLELLQPHLAPDALRAALPEAQAALSSMLRGECPGAEMLGWLSLPKAPRREIEAIIDEGKRIQDAGECLVVAGIGGSYLGARAAIEALADSAPFPVLFAGNSLSPAYHARLLDSLAGKKFSICVISKSGTTTEPAIAFRLLREALEGSCGAGGCRDRIVAVTDPRSGALRKMAGAQGWKSFAIPPDVGGRFSVLSPVGLLPMAAAGIPVGEVIEGAAAAMGRYTSPGTDNDALRYAAARTLLHRAGTSIEVLSVFEPSLALFCEWWKQLAGESEGKTGRGLFPASTVMTTDLHSLGQLLQEGTRSILETFLVVARPARDLRVPAAGDDLDGLGYLAGRSLSEIDSTALEGTREAHSAGGLPIVTLEVQELVPETLGRLFVFFEVAIAVSGLLAGVNPFDQPGVDEYKKRMFRLLGRPGA